VGYHLASAALVRLVPWPRPVRAGGAARLARGETPPGTACALQDRLLPGWPEDLAEIVYIDHFGNAVTGIRAAEISNERRLRLNQHIMPYARTFSAVPEGQAFWYENANGLVEIAVNRGRADQALGLASGDTVSLI